jgi:hypothetical protein
MTRFWRLARGFWERDPGLSVILGLLVLIVFVLPPLAPSRGDRGALINLAVILLLFAGVAGLKVPTLVRIVLLAAASIAAVVRWWPASGDAAVAAASLAGVALMATVVLAQTFRGGTVSVHRVQGAVAAYLLLGVAWAFAYELTATIVPSAFSIAQAAQQERGWQYFSFVTLTTLGYGDITPVHPIARSLAMMEALTGQLYPAILIGRLVSLQTQPAREEK